jgi:hypothetical protein
VTYGLNSAVFIEDGAAARAERVRLARSTARSWNMLDRDRRLALIDRALRPANDLIDGYPLAL